MFDEQREDLYDRIMAMPDAPKLMQRLEHSLSEEKRRRRQFYNDITEADKAEFINGEVIMHSPVKKEHNDVSTRLFELLGPYVRRKKLGYLGYEKVMVSLTRNDYEPDICFFGTEKAAAFQEGQVLFPAPDLVVEVLSKKTEKYDRTIKFTDYAQHGVGEYWIIDPLKEFIEQYRLNDSGQYELVLKGRSGIVECTVIAGFDIPANSLFDEEAQLATMDVLHRK